MSVNNDGTASERTQPDPIRPRHDPKVSCPVVCGQSMRASGFFFESGSGKYLITARHNLRPTVVEVKTPYGNRILRYSLGDRFSEVDVYLRADDGWHCENLSVDDRLDSTLNAVDTDVVALRVDFDPSAYDYRIWTIDDIGTPETEGEELMLIGFDGASFPEVTKYAVSTYREGIDGPRIVPFENSLRGMDDFGISAGIGLDLEAAGGYSGLSGSPVLGEGLVGVHVSNEEVPANVAEKMGVANPQRLGYFRAELLRRLR
ncbi:hypothetical protein N0B31_17735 [Salinirubellus salinus]|uniref:Serine protease n=1 Tax=Salinirubellus salinus TaxID=1364945 RepID=A0A9E7R1H3_9EURY|nr:hypothetical protein [Salinirubellus salinus]UWM53954.1 hypothetical protein N0B31_17735 [Salinirubellus salinus]